ncbi:uncharacterized protein DEA37_0005975 [Paragonimus westermani]|uniref:DUF155 domain-containing protein n=1 Tax=Paragonimus westermani TaxID=34504 RepID=A0A5J4NLE2_9TREM|nr:uncharacterized protein DEA37_0005975 [Paragonimus westermani]
MKLTESSLDLGVPLTTGHLGKKRADKSLVSTDTTGFLNVSAYGIAQYVDLDGLRAHLSNLDAYQCASLPSELSTEVVLISSKYAPTSNTQRDVFIFRCTIVTFEIEMRTFPVFFASYVYLYRSFSHFLIIETVLLSFGICPKQSIDCFSLAFVHSVKNCWLILLLNGRISGIVSPSESLFKLSLLENRFDTVAIQMEPWIAKMKTGLGINFPQSRVLKKTGELFTLRHLLNISTSMIDTPDFYWDRPEVEALYNQLRSALSVSARTRVLNSKLNMCCELTEILSNHLQSRHSSRLEWMIIALILVEVAFEAFYYHERRVERRLSIGNTAVPT